MNQLSTKVNEITGRLVNAHLVTQTNYEIMDSNGMVLKKGQFAANEQYRIDNVGFVVGANTLKVSATYADGDIQSQTLKFINLSESNVSNLSIDSNDSDNDGVINYIEDLYGTNQNNPDTDGDLLNDYEEIAILGTNPMQKDSDSNQITDDKEDLDKDSLCNGYELKIKTDPICSDSDYDGLYDGTTACR